MPTEKDDAKMTTKQRKTDGLDRGRQRQTLRKTETDGRVTRTRVKK